MKKSNNVGHSIKLSKETIDNLKIGIVVSRFNNDITEEMVALKGLEENDRIVKEGLSRLSKGMTVKPIIN